MDRQYLNRPASGNHGRTMEPHEAVQNLSLLSQPAGPVAGHSGNVSEDYNVYGNPVFNIICDPYYEKVEKRGQQLEEAFHSLKSSHPREATELLRHYHGLTAKIEMEKLGVIITSNRRNHQRLNNYFNYQRQKLIVMMESKLKELQNKSIEESTDSGVNWKAVKLMQNWYTKNKHHPYPTAQDIKHLSILGNINETDIETWFNFERMRQAATKS